MSRFWLPAVAVSLLLWQGHGHAQTPAPDATPLAPLIPGPNPYSASYNDYGGTGLLQMPNARHQQDGELGVTVSHAYPYYRYAVSIQALPWLEGTVRYTQIQNRLYGAESFSGDQQYKDRGFDLKMMLMREGRYNPQLSLGLRDIAGSDLFTSEFLVASRRYYDLDFTLGLAWGNAGTRGQLTNPFGALSSSMKKRKGTTGAGAVSMPFFTGETMGLFGGVEYLTAIEGLRLKLEYDSNDYSQEALGNVLPVRSGFNVGAEYQLSPWAEVSAAYERGNTFMLRGTVRSNFNKFKGIPRTDAPPAPVVRVKTTPPDDPVAALPPQLTAELEKDEMVAIRRFGAERNMVVGDIKLAEQLKIQVDGTSGLPRVEDAAALALFASQRLSVLVELVVVTVERQGMPISDIWFDRERLEQSRALTGTADTLLGANERDWNRLSDAPLPAPVAATSELKVVSHSLALGNLPWSKAATTPVAEKIFNTFAANGLTASAVALTDLQATVRFSNDKYRIATLAFSRAARLVANVAPASVEVIVLELEESGMGVSQMTVMRKDIDALAQYKGSPQEIRAHAILEAAAMDMPENAVANASVYPKFDWSLSPKLRQHMGGPDNFYFYQIYASLGGQVKLAKGLTAGASIGQNLYNNFDQLKLASDSQLPHVRSDIKDYLKGGSTWIDGAVLNYNTRLTPSLYGRVTVGMLELMFGGVSSEVLYYPQGQSWAVGMDLSRVTQRDPSTTLGFRDYSVTTGHLSWYQNLPFYDLRAIVRVGHYLAGDNGVTLELERKFENGISVGVFATKTDVSSEQFGEGSFDKGFHISIPLDLFTGTNARDIGTYVFRPLTRDGGQRLGQPSLYSTIQNGDITAIDNSWGVFGE